MSENIIIALLTVGGTALAAYMGIARWTSNFAVPTEAYGSTPEGAQARRRFAQLI